MTTYGHGRTSHHLVPAVAVDQSQDRNTMMTRTEKREEAGQEAIETEIHMTAMIAMIQTTGIMIALIVLLYRLHTQIQGILPLGEAQVALPVLVPVV